MWNISISPASKGRDLKARNVQSKQRKVIRQLYVMGAMLLPSALNGSIFQSISGHF